jgi:hypothetical protein
VKLGRTLEDALESPFNLGLLAAALPPWVFRAALRSFDLDPRSFFFSFLWSNIRVPPGLREPAGATVERVWVRGSLPRQPGVGLVAVADARQVTVAVEYLAAQVSEASVAELRERFLAQVAAIQGPRLQRMP